MATDDILQGAKDALSKAGSFTKSVEGKTPGTFAPKAAPKSAAPAAKSPQSGQTGIMREASDAGQGIKNRMEQSSKALGTFKKGGVVPKTGNYKLHQGEKVIPAEKANMDKNQMDMASAAMKAAKKPGKKLRMTIEQTDNDRFMVDHDEQGQEPNSRSRHAMSDVKELHQHIDKHFGSPNGSGVASNWEKDKAGDKEAQPSGKDTKAAGAKD